MNTTLLRAFRLAAIAAPLVAVAPAAEARVKASSSNGYHGTGPQRLGDVTGDGHDEIITLVEGNAPNMARFRVSRPDYGHAPLAADYLISAVSGNATVLAWWTGHFDEGNRESVCYLDSALQTNCLLFSGFSFYPMVSRVMTAGFSGAEPFVVGDFDGDGIDELMTYSWSGGVMRLALYRYGSSGFALDTTAVGGHTDLRGSGAFDFAQLVGAQCPGQSARFFVGNFYDDVAGRRKDDLLLECYGAGAPSRFIRYDTHAYGGQNVFWWAFTSDVIAGEQRQYQFYLADADGDGFEDLLRVDTQIGGFEAHQLRYGHAMPLLPNVSYGQVNVSRRCANMTLQIGKMSFFEDTGSPRRDDILLTDDCGSIRYDARFDGVAPYTYWWAYTM